MLSQESLKSTLIVTALALSIQLAFCLAQNVWAASSQGVLTFSTPVNRPQHQSTNIDYKVDYHTARYFVYLPANYTPGQAFGLIDYVSAFDSVERLPDGWAEVLQRNKLLFVAPLNAGNHIDQERRCGLAVLGALEMMRYYNVDKNRVYAAGISGGARTASDLGLTQSDIFSGTIQDCGTDFYRDVPKRYATGDTDTNGNHYGLVASTASEVADARSKTKFVLITGSGDFRRGNILDIYNGGFAAEGFRAKLIDVPGMGHQDCDGTTLQQALDFLR
jgi:hypothetical protein